MTPPKLSDSEKYELITLYRQGGHTMATLGQRYGVSTSTVGRILKLAAEEPVPAPVSAPAPIAPPVVTAAPEAPMLELDPQPPQVDPMVDSGGRSGGRSISNQSAEPTDGTTGTRRVRRRSRSGASELSESALPESVAAPEPTPAKPMELPAMETLPLFETAFATAAAEPLTEVVAELEAEAKEEVRSSRVGRPVKKQAEATTSTNGKGGRSNRRRKGSGPVVAEINEASAEEADDADLGADLDLDDDDLDLDEDDFEFGDDDGEAGIAAMFGRGANPDQPIEIMPLETSRIPNPCYLVIDRAAELVARPLEDFRELGQIPPQEAASRTLPVFDNHRVARRFSARNQRIIKVPDANDLFQKTGPYLQAKGITHLLIDGQVYLL
ncbi:hypothetical protein H6G51_15005 [Limnothrix sp. FACHB-708]|uniref:hypothetical protein n=1 Tax=unclassified Limnothrix TaxID=2632864 RepID=UPI0016849987|nr:MULTISPECIES: hypothetical protein [unclassified Limnothrix]MBD2554595.1 hypothetical protein [Limnothrix sp. FACHB-708]MBD2591628.1 hypothetical protein [Limnothrix sp. FACHB-406]